MDITIDGNMYLIKDNTLKFENDKYESTEFILLKKWLILSKKPSTEKHINKLEQFIDINLKNILQGCTYDYNNQYETKSFDELFKIPEIYLRYNKILNIDITI
jgi:hypothetical protein